jgi:hypothetical protein
MKRKTLVVVLLNFSIVSVFGAVIKYLAAESCKTRGRVAIVHECLFKENFMTFNILLRIEAV